jgi:DNA-binding GntR family transcriptional regulator
LETNFPIELQRKFEAQLREGVYEKGRTLDCETLAQELEASTEKMHEVLVAEERKGLVKRQVNGTYQVLGVEGIGIASVFVHAESSGLRPVSTVRVVELEPASAEVAKKLEVEAGTPVYRFERTRHINNEIVANQTNYIPFQLCPEFEHDDVSNSSFQKLLESKYMITANQAVEESAITTANQQDSEILGLQVDDPILEVQRVVLSPSGLPVVWATIRIRPDRYHYVAGLWPEAAELLSSEQTDE